LIHYWNIQDPKVVNLDLFNFNQWVPEVLPREFGNLGPLTTQKTITESTSILMNHLISKHAEEQKIHSSFTISLRSNIDSIVVENKLKVNFLLLDHLNWLVLGRVKRFRVPCHGRKNFAKFRCFYDLRLLPINGG
jgi:hypothetical protein